MYRKQVRRRRAILVLLVVAALVLLSTQFSEREGGPLHSAQRAIASVFGPLEEGASRALKLRSIVRKAGSGKQVRLRLALSKKTLRAVRRALRRGAKLSAKVTVVATDAAGNSRKSTRRVRLKR